MRAPVLLVMGLGVLLGVLLLMPAWSDVFVREVWKRNQPLKNPLLVASVTNGTITLADGRSLKPAGVERREDVSPADYDLALQAAVAQGVVMIRDLGDGRAFLLAEPKFYNWCGTHDRFEHWAGSYLQCPVSELLIYTGYGTGALDEPGLTERERWRLEGAGHLPGADESPRRISSKSDAFRFDGAVNEFSDYDAAVEWAWHAPPP